MHQLHQLYDFCSVDKRETLDSPTGVAVKKALKWLVNEQREDGRWVILKHWLLMSSWFGRWGICFIFGTWSALCALAETGVKENTAEMWDKELLSWPSSPETNASSALAPPNANDAVTKGAAFLRDTQNPDGGWGEACLVGSKLRAFHSKNSRNEQ